MGSWAIMPQAMHAAHAGCQSSRMAPARQKPVAILAIVLAGWCGTACVKTTVKKLPIDEQAALNHVSQATRVRLEVQPLGVLPYDGYTLPIVAHSGGEGPPQAASTIFSQVSPQVDFRAQLKVPSDSPWAGAFLDPPIQPRLIAATMRPGQQPALAIRQIWPRLTAELSPEGENRQAITFMGRAADASHLLIEEERSQGRSRAIGQLDLATSTILWRTPESDEASSIQIYNFAAIPIKDRISGPLVFARWWSKSPEKQADVEDLEPDPDVPIKPPFSSNALWSAGLYLAPEVRSEPSAGRAPEPIKLWEQPGRALWPLAVSPDRKLLAVLSIVTLDDSLAADELIILSLEPWRGVTSATQPVADPLILARRSLAGDRTASGYLQRLSLWSRQTIEPWPPRQVGDAASAICGIADGSGGLLAFDVAGALGAPGLTMMSSGQQASVLSLAMRDASGAQQSQPGVLMARSTGLWWLVQPRSVDGQRNVRSGESRSTPTQAIRIHQQEALFRLMDQSGAGSRMLLLEPDNRADRVALRISLAQLVSPLGPGEAAPR